MAFLQPAIIYYWFNLNAHAISYTESPIALDTNVVHKIHRFVENYQNQASGNCSHQLHHRSMLSYAPVGWLVVDNREDLAPHLLVVFLVFSDKVVSVSHPTQNHLH